MFQASEEISHNKGRDVVSHGKILFAFAGSTLGMKKVEFKHSDVFEDQCQKLDEAF